MLLKVFASQVKLYKRIFGRFFVVVLFTIPLKKNFFFLNFSTLSSPYLDSPHPGTPFPSPSDWNLKALNQIIFLVTKWQDALPRIRQNSLQHTFNPTFTCKN